jgi:ABC-type amino acid transport system permease subunit
VKIDFWSDNTMTEFWGYVRMLLEGVSPGIMLTVAVAAVGIMVGIVVKAFKSSSEDEEDEDYEVKHY